MLHVTNGDSAAARLRDAGVGGDVLAWRDALHEGPVPGGLAPHDLRAARARFIAARGWADEAAALAELTERDDRLERAVDRGEEIGLWFETDLYDVLQLAQILDRVPPGRAWLVLVGTDRFRALSELGAGELRAHPRAPVTAELAAELAALWAALRSADPRALNDLSGDGVVAGAALRLRQHFPWRHDGLNRTERALLRAVADGARTPVEAFLAQQRGEERPFLGDTIAFGYLDALPVDGDFRLTAEARAILAGEQRWAGPAGERWIGGMRLAPGAPSPRYDPGTGRLV